MKPIILNATKLFEDIAYYADRFPEAKPVTYDNLVKNIEASQDTNPEGSVFGYSVSPACEDRCFLFSSKVNDDKCYIVEYKGVCKI